MSTSLPIQVLTSDDVTIRNINVEGCGSTDSYNGFQLSGDDITIEFAGDLRPEQKPVEELYLKSVMERVAALYSGMLSSKEIKLNINYSIGWKW